MNSAQQTLVTEAARLSWLAYRDPKDVQSSWATCHNSTTTLTDCNKILPKIVEQPRYVTCVSCDAQCYLVKYAPPPEAGLGDEPILVICSRGTTSLMDWMCNFQAEQTSFRDASDKTVPNVLVHAGFYKQFMGLYSICDIDIKKHLSEGGLLLCTGHSLGSAISTIAALNYGNKYPGQVFYIGFGTPRCGNSGFASKFGQVVNMRYRIKNLRDPVDSIVPPLNYVHVGQEYHLGDPDPLPDIPILLDVADHYIQNYIKNLTQPQKAQPTATLETRQWYQRVLDNFRWA